MMGLIDLNTTEDDGETPSSASSASLSSHSGISTSASGLAPPSSSSASASVCLELWHACAGPMISLPKKGSIVVYSPQGHFEQHLQDFPVAAYKIPPHVFCRVLDVKLHAEEGVDEVYCQISLVPESEQVERKLREGEIDAYGEDEDAEVAVKSTTPHMFCKTLTASDTSTHGGFSVPRRAAEDCFPPLDYNQQRPSQELVAKDLHGLEWRFRHIYRGQPRRHLLTTGWSAFVNKKKLVSGDAVLFLRGDDGVLRLGIRRASQLKSGGNFSVPSSLQLNPSSVMDVVNAISSRCAFSICYSPRVSSSEFIIPLHKFLKSLDNFYSVGMRFKLRFETEDAAERRCTGLIIGISDVDPIRWPGSKWKCLMVRWDDMEATRLNRVSPWEIEPSGSASTSNNFNATGLKRTRISLPSKMEFPIPNGIGASDFGESLRFQKVLQGQEILGVNTRYDGINSQSHHHPLTEIRRCYPSSSNCSGIIATTGNNSLRIPPQVNSDVSCNGIGFSESFRFQKVLQGQEILPSQPYGRSMSVNEARGNGRYGIFDGCQMMRLHPCVPPPGQASSPSSVLMFQQVVNPVSNCEGRIHHVSEIKGGNFASASSYEQQLPQGTKSHNQEMDSSYKRSCRLFGFSLTPESHIANEEANPNPGDEFHGRHSLRSRVVGGNNYTKCTRV
ncbi:auxin response factor 3 [Senna tora]|uniref:Auxin response factor n=1 Tax=Senna tora TaxID=362788 RepID=A0A834STZ9_9FABA|nr:auxin response factor 3 [Senna tora]